METKAKCRAHKSDGTSCGNWPIRGAAVCGHHGGKAAQVRRAAERRTAQAGAEAAVRRLAAVREPVEPLTDPVAALALLAARSLRWSDLMGEHIAELEDLRYRGIAGEQIDGRVQLYTRSLTEAANIVTALAKLGLDERQVRVEEARVDLFAEVVRAMFADPDLNLTSEQAAVAPTVLARHLRLVAS